MANPFREAEARFHALNEERDSGQLTAEAHAQQLGGLQVTAHDGAVWQQSADSGEWMRWDGQQWGLGDPYGDEFDNLALRFQHLQEQRDTGQLAQDPYAQEVDKLRVNDPDGTVWAIDAQSGAWLKWNGQEWLQEEPRRRNPDGSPTVGDSPFVEFEQRFNEVRESYAKGAIDESEFRAKVMKFRLVDEHGDWWQLSPDAGTWLKWDGKQWQTEDPPRESASTAGPTRKFAKSVGESAKEELKTTVRSLPRRILRSVVTRVIMAGIGYFSGTYLNAYFAGYKNDGFNFDGSKAWSSWLFVNNSPHGNSYAVIWGIGGMLLTSLVFTLFKKGGGKRFLSALAAPFTMISRMRNTGKLGLGALAVGAGVAMIISGVSGVNQKASLSLGIGMLFIGAGLPGRYLARFMIGIVRRVVRPKIQAVKSKIKVDLRIVQLAIVGVAPGFYIASRIPEDRLWIFAIPIIALGVYAIASSKKKRVGAPAICLILLCAVVATFLATLWDWLFADEAMADDGGKDEFGGDADKYWETEGGRLVDHSRPAGEATAVGAAVGNDLDDGEMEQGDYTISLTLDSYTKSMYENGSDQVRAWITASGPDYDKCRELEEEGNPLIEMSITGNVSDWFSAETEVDETGATCNFSVEIPTDPELLTGPNIAFVTAELSLEGMTVTQRCRINLDVEGDYWLQLTPLETQAQANSGYSSMFAEVTSLDMSLNEEERRQKILEYAEKIKFVAAGDEGNWIGGPGEIAGTVAGLGQELSLAPAVQPADLSKVPPFWAEIEASCEIDDGRVLSKGGRLSISPPDWILEYEVQQHVVASDGKDAAKFLVKASPADSSFMDLYDSGDGNLLNSFITVRADGDNAEHAVIRDLGAEGDWKAYEVSIAGSYVERGSPYVDIVMDVTLTGTTVSQNFQVRIESKTHLRVRESVIGLRPGGTPNTIHADVHQPGDEDWDLRYEIQGASGVFVEGEPVKSGVASFALTLDAEGPPTGRPGIRTGTLRLQAFATAYDGTETTTDPIDVQIKVVEPGLYVTPEIIRLPFDPAVEPATKFRVQALTFDDDTHEIGSSLDKVTDLIIGEWEDGNVPGGANIFRGSGVYLMSEGLEGGGAAATAIWSATQEIQIPAPQEIDAITELTAPGDFGDQADLFTTRHTFRAQVDPVAAYVELIRVEQENCRKILKYMPPGELRDKFSETIDVHGRNLGAEGLFYIRHLIWQAAHAALRDEAESYLTSARAWNAMAEAADWVQYLAGLIVQGMSSVLVPFPGDLAVNLLYQAIPDMVNKVARGMSPADWAIQWVYGFVEGIPTMAAEMALGQALDFDKLVRMGVEKFQDLRKALAVACLAIWLGRFTFWLARTKPNGEPYSLKECVLNALRDLAEEIITTGIGQNTADYEAGLHAPGLTRWIDEYDPRRRDGYDPDDGRSYRGGRDAPDTSGMPTRNIEAARKIAQDLGIDIYVRPTSPHARALLEAGAHPKPEFLKVKSLSELDIELAKQNPNLHLTEGDLGKIGYFDPGPDPPVRTEGMTAGEHARLVDRYNQRKNEFANNAKDMADLPEGATVDPDTGIVYHKDGEPFTGDHDIYDIRNGDGTKVSKEKYDAAMTRLREYPFSVQHPGHRQWDYSHYSREAPPPFVDDAGNLQTPQSPYDKYHGIDERIQDSHGVRTSSGEQGEGLIKIDSEGGISTSYTSTSQMDQHDGYSRASESAAAAERRRVEDYGGEEEDYE